MGKSILSNFFKYSSYLNKRFTWSFLVLWSYFCWFSGAKGSNSLSFTLLISSQHYSSTTFSQTISEKFRTARTLVLHCRSLSTSLWTWSNRIQVDAIEVFPRNGRSSNGTLQSKHWASAQQHARYSILSHFLLKILRWLRGRLYWKWNHSFFVTSHETSVQVHIYSPKINQHSPIFKPSRSRSSTS